MSHHIPDELTRRDFMITAGACALASAAVPSLPAAHAISTPELHEALFYESVKDGSVNCLLCPHACKLANNERGRCRARENRGGRLYSLVHSRPCGWATDPIEKKPFFHVYPGSFAFSISTVGCNFTCRFCQNWQTSQADPYETESPVAGPDRIVEMALKDPRKPRTIAYTYTEPIIFYEYMLDCAKAARDAGLGNVMVSNGYIRKEPMEKLCKALTAIKIDFKSFTDSFYQEVCGGMRQPVLDTLKTLKDSGIWFEIVNLVIPTLNDNTDDIKRMTEWIMKELGPDVPIHFTRFHGEYKLRNLPQTPIDVMHEARKIAMDQGCHFVYTGNMPGGEGEKTFCPKCRTELIHRAGYFVVSDSLAGGKCHKCGTSIPGLWAAKSS